MTRPNNANCTALANVGKYSEVHKPNQPNGGTVYTSLSTTQQDILNVNECPHCHAHGTMKEVWTRTGKSVQCTQCKKRVYRPRGRAVTKGGATTGGSAGGSSDVQSSNAPTQGSGQGESDAVFTQGNAQGAQQGNAPGKQCPKCGGEMKQRTGRFGDFHGCSNYPKCEHTEPIKGKQGTQSQQQQNKPSDILPPSVRELASVTKDAISALAQKQKELEEKMEQQVQELAQEMQEELAAERARKPLEVSVTQQDANGKTQTQVNKVPTPHKLLPEILRRYSVGIRNFLLVGPSGTGKTTLLEQLALALGMPYFLTSWFNDMPLSAIIGRTTPDGSVYFASPFVSALEQSSVHNNDEVDRGDPSVTVALNSALANYRMFIPSRVNSTEAIRHANNIQAATANTWGYGADMLYCGSNQLDAAFKSRFAGGVLFVDYDTDLETSLVPEDPYRLAFWEIRQRIFDNKLRRIWGTRELIMGAKLLRGGYTIPETLQVLSTGFTPDELQKVGIP